ncbi:MAG: AgmX/PglI C-terminal domain-containing protein [Steroidobacteraceae bacterium]|jgi:TonB family protein|nr:AgmX/PglI C-terminal domain-containing protein [Steroidobacteraceae bacterium]
MATTTAPFRIYDLPWTPSDEERSRLRRLLVICFSVTLLLSVLVPLLPTPPRTRDQAQEPPPRLAKLVLERKSTPPPAPPKVDPVPQISEQPRVTPQPAPSVDRTQEARRRASQAGLLPFQDQLAALRDNAALEKAGQAKNLMGAVGAATRAERSLITSRVGSGSGGINTAALSRGYGAGAGALSGHETTQVSSAIGAPTANENVRRGGGSQASRSEEEIALVFDRNKGAIYALYKRALRDNPQLQGKVVLELTITPDGSVTHCEVVSSELQDPELERKLAARVKMFRFEAKEVATIKVTKPIDFFPA